MSETIENKIDDWVKQRKDVLKLPEDISLELNNNSFFKEWKKRIRYINGNDLIVFEDESYLKRSRSVEKFKFSKNLIKYFLEHDCIRKKDSENKVGKTSLGLEPLSIAQIISFAKNKPIENFLKKENTYFNLVADKLFEKIIGNKDIKYELDYNVNEASKTTDISGRTIRGAIETKLLPAEIKNRQYNISGIDLVLYVYKKTSSNSFSEKEIKEMFNFPDIDFKKLELSSDSKGNYGRNSVFSIYDKITNKIKKKFFEFDFFKPDEVYAFPEEYYSINDGFFSIEIRGKWFEISSRCAKEININSSVFSEKKIKKEMWEDNFFKKSIKNYFFSNLVSIISQEEPEKDKEGYKIYRSLNIKTNQLWNVYVVNNLIEKFEVTPLKDYLKTSKL